jgi:Xaa-Pro aminopeptidase
VLLDLWAKEDAAEAVYADVTWMGFVGAEPPVRITAAFDDVARARDLGVETIARLHAAGGPVPAWQVDRAVRDFLDARHPGRFLHRTGHSIGAHAVHGDGANLDDFETHDVRALVPGLCFSIEPGIYLDDFGVRSEIDVVLEDDGPKVYTPPQRELVRLAG